MCRKAQHHLTEGQHHFEERENIIFHFTAQMNEVALRANGTEHLSHIGATILNPNTKVLDFQGLFVFLGVKNNPLSTLHLFLNLLVSNLRLEQKLSPYN